MVVLAAHTAAAAPLDPGTAAAAYTIAGMFTVAFLVLCCWTLVRRD